MLAVVPHPAAGQDAPCGSAHDRFPFPPPLASPLEPHTRLAPAHVSRGDRSRWVGLADLGDRLVFWIERGCPPRNGPDARSGKRRTDAPGPRAPAGPRPSPHDLRRPTPGARSGPRIAGSLAGGVFSRFDLEGNGNELVEAHYRVGLRLRAGLRALEARLEAYHVSSHLGDEFMERTGRSPISTSREGLELLVQGRPARRLRLYGGPGVLVRSTRGLDPGSARAGAEWEGGDRGGPAPYVSAEAWAWQEVDWTPMLAGEAGVVVADGRLRAALLAGTGPPRAEQFLDGPRETLWGLSFALAW